MDGGGRQRDDDEVWEAELALLLAAAGEPVVPEAEPCRVETEYTVVRAYQMHFGIGTRVEGDFFYDVGECVVRMWWLRA